MTETQTVNFNSVATRTAEGPSAQKMDLNSNTEQVAQNALQNGQNRGSSRPLKGRATGVEPCCLFLIICGAVFTAIAWAFCCFASNRQ